MGRIASFHLISEPMHKAPLAMARLAVDRPRLRRTPGLAFWRLLGTGRGRYTGPGADLRRTALFAVWDDESDLDRFLEQGRIGRRWRNGREAWHVRLRGVGGQGSWRGVDPLAGLEPGSRDGPVAIITRADVHRHAGRSFSEAAKEVDTELRTAGGLIDVVGIGEAPIGKLATFSLWESAADARRFAYRMPRHQRVIEQTRDGDWYGEEMFARFEPYGSQGRWDGRDPLADR
ncbi:MAG: spheroidene monooxygenase [Actinomycetota bacterium]